MGSLKIDLGTMLSGMNLVLLMVAALAFSDETNRIGAKSIKDLSSGSYMTLGTPDGQGEHAKCSASYIKGHCMYSTECLRARGYPSAVCKNGILYGSCCTETTSLSLIEKKKHIKDEDNEIKSKVEYECGKVYFGDNLDGRIVNGSAATFGQFPWQVSLSVVKFETFLLHICGATLINQNYAVTGAHCVHKVPQEILMLRMGEHNMTDPSEPFPVIDRLVQKITTHPDFRRADFYKDIALLKMDRPIEFQPNVVPICLPGNRNLLVGKSAIVSGWGKFSVNGQRPSVLHKVTLPIMSNRECENIFNKGYIREPIYDIFLCAGFEMGGKDACLGDSGGPLQLKGKDNRFFLAGIVSWGYGCAEPFRPGVYTRISEFVPWIVENIAER